MLHFISGTQRLGFFFFFVDIKFNIQNLAFTEIDGASCDSMLLHVTV